MPIQIKRINGKYQIFGDGNHRVRYAQKNNITHVWAIIYPIKHVYSSKKELEYYIEELKKMDCIEAKSIYLITVGNGFTRDDLQQVAEDGTGIGRAGGIKGKLATVIDTILFRGDDYIVFYDKRQKGDIISTQPLKEFSK